MPDPLEKAVKTFKNKSGKFMDSILTILFLFCCEDGDRTRDL